jgi:SLIT-ROBO Rho GTPase activating protein
MAAKTVAMPLSEGIVKINSKALEPSELKKYDKLEKEGIFANGAVLKDIRVQLNDQLKCLDSRLEIQQGIVTEFQDVFRRKAEIELNYSKELDKLAKSITNRNKEHKQKRDGWQLFSSMQVWEQLVSQTKKSSRDHAALAEIYTTHINQRCSNINEDLQRVYRKCREIGYEIHEEVLKVLHELHTAMKTHHNYQSEFRQAETKLQVFSNDLFSIFCFDL